ncbi:MAG: hypothetical protein IJ244_04500, partial [Bacteroidaceae bacterium]|nr:hypothetical protein [Bacteroidaceae bacterium]
MKKVFRIMTLGAIALLGAVGFSACSSDENVVEDNPTFDGETVRTDFAFNIATPKTKMTAANTQQDGIFKGMQDMYLLPFKGAPAAGATTNNAINYGLGSLASGDITDAQSSRVYALSIPVGTTDFLFYATATKKETDTDSEKGKISKTIDATSVDAIQFNLESIATSLGSDATNLAAYLTAVAQAEDENSNKWSDAASLANAGGAFSSLASLYEKFTTIGSGEARSGSMESVQRLMLDLYKSAKKIDEEATDPDVKKVAQAIYTAITTGVSGISVTVDETGAADNWTLAINGPDANFPANLELPMGAAQLKYDNASRSFSYIESDDELIVTPGTTQVLSEPNVSLSKIVYPSELVYYCNSPLWASEVYKTAADYPITTGDWDQTPGTSPSGSEVLFSSDWNKEVVSSKTRAVAMRNNVNYGVALLQSTVKLAADATTMEDNRNAIIGDDDQTFTVAKLADDDPDPDNVMQVTGILIGGQPNKVGWKMIQEGSDASFSDVIYDKDVQYGSALTTSSSAANYTMVFDNYTNKPDQPDVLFALEIKNGDKDFYGAKNMIPKNSTF